MFSQNSSLKRPLSQVKCLFVSIAFVLVILTVGRSADAASIFGSNLIVNGDAESGTGSTTGGPVSSIPGWSTGGSSFTVIQYGSPEFPALTDPGPKKRGKNFFAGGSGTESSKGTQTIDVSGGALAIDTGKTEFLLSGWLGGYANQGDNAVLTIVFYNESKTKIGSAVIGPATAADRNNATGFAYKDKSDALPEGTRSIGVALVMTRTDGSYNDGYADDLGLVLTAPPTTATKTSLASSEYQVTTGSAVSLTALVTPASGPSTPTGTVTFKFGSTALGTVTLNGTGQATLKTTSLPVGSDSVTATYNDSLIFKASTSSAVEISVTAASAITLSPTTLSFPNTAAGATSTAKQITVRNTGKNSATFTSILLKGSQTDDFTLTNACGSSLASGASCTVAIAFKPVSIGAKSATLTAADNAGGSPQTVALSGSGINAASAPGVKLSASSLSFANQNVSTISAAKTVTLMNSGTATLALSSIVLSGGQADDFVIQKNCASTLAPGAQCTLSISFKPVSTGAKTASITIADNASSSPQSVKLSGTGVAGNSAVADLSQLVAALPLESPLTFSALEN